MSPRQEADTFESEQVSRRQMMMATGVIGTAGLAGCNGLGGGEDGNASNSASQNQMGDISIRYIPHGAPGTDPFWQAQSDGWNMAVDQLGVDGAYQAPSESGAYTDQVQNIETAIDSGVDAIAVTLPDPGLFEDTLQRAADEGIYVIVTNVTDQDYLAEGEQSMPYNGYIGQNEAQVGETLASNTLPLFEETAGSATDRALILNHDPGHSALALRQDGIERVLNNQDIPHDWIDVPGGDPSGVISRIASSRTSNPDTDLLFSLGPTAGDPAIDYIENEGLEDEVYHAGVDISADQAVGLREGYNLAQVIQQPALQGYLAAHYMTQHLQVGFLTPRHTPTGPTFVTADNVAAVQQQLDEFGVA